mgnify:FL=1
MTKNKKIKHFSIDEKIENSKFSYTKNLKYFIIAPIIIIVVGIILLCTLGFNLGFDFTGGTNMTIFVNSSDWADENFSVQVYDIDDDYETICNKISNVLNKYGLTASSFQKTTIDIDADRGLGYVITDGDAVIVKFQNGDIADEDVENQNNQIRFDLLKEFGFIPESSNFEGFDFESNVNSALVANGGVTTASASAELMMKSFLALFVAVIVILIYVALRFEITAGLAAILALFHDVLITASVMLICRIQINTAFIAALITILGYSINNTIIIFDRIRENLKMSKNLGKVDNNQIANKAVSGTMMRTILTTVTTFIMIFFITVIGVADIQQFAFPIMVGIIAGFYSSVFLTPGLWAIAYKPSKKKLARMAEKEKKKAEKAKQGQQYEV